MSKYSEIIGSLRWPFLCVFFWGGWMSRWLWYPVCRISFKSHWLCFGIHHAVATHEVPVLRPTSLWFTYKQLEDSKEWHRFINSSAASCLHKSLCTSGSSAGTTACPGTGSSPGSPCSTLSTGPPCTCRWGQLGRRQERRNCQISQGTALQVQPKALCPRGGRATLTHCRRHSRAGEVLSAKILGSWKCFLPSLTWMESANLLLLHLFCLRGKQAWMNKTSKDAAQI